MLQKFTSALLFCTVLGTGAAKAQSTSIIFPRQSVWKYLDDGSNQDTAWRMPGFNDASWASGPAELGYGDNDEATVVSYGPNANAKYPTTYFRTTFNLTTLPSANQQVQLILKRDDGPVVYINGVEVYRENLPAGPISYNTWALGDVSNESAFITITLNNHQLQIGTNTIAVEMHQRNATSTDLSFDLELKYYTLIPAIECDSNLTATHISRFLSVMPSAQPDSIRIPETHTFQMLVQQGDPYTDTADGVTKGLFDFTGYVSPTSSSDTGYLSINHELGSFPAAGVSMLTMHFDKSSNTWNVTNNKPVDFSGVEGTGRNCSGAVTPWNTIITSEETLPTRDNNGDGFQDIGWHVEIDPVTATIKEYGNNKQEKLWKMGRMSHENVVIASDEKTAYYGNDENPGFIFKFVAHTARDLSEGDLYVMKLDGPLDNVTTGTWIGIPNSTPADCNNTRAFAAAVGGTNFFNVEDVEISPLDGKIYFTSKSSSRVYRFKDNGNTVSQVEVFVGNESTIYNITTANGIVPEQWRDGVDNLTFDDKGNLYVIQDGGRNHVYMVPPCHTQTNPAVKLFMVTPAGCEPTGMTFSPDYRFMFISLQHPSSSNSALQKDAAGNMVKFDKESAIVIARKEILGPDAVVTSVKETTMKFEHLDVYPNPTDGQLNISISSRSNSTALVQLYNAQGALVQVKTERVNAGYNKLNLDMSALPVGIYQVIVTTDGKGFAAKVLKN